MDITKLELANKLNGKIKQLQLVLNYFEVELYFSDNSINEKVSTHPSIIIEFDGKDGDRDRMHLPTDMERPLINLIITEIKKDLKTAVNEFNSL
ncbi:MAG: hypothetical protein ACOYOV_11105 [Bacteroidales bacterium]